jgi:translation initiation factor 1A
MPKRKSKRKVRREPSKRDLEYKDDGQEYADVLKMLGNGRCEVKCIDGITRLAIIRGNMRNKVWIKIGDFVLVGLRDFQDSKCDILLKYTQEEVRTLKAYGEIPEKIGQESNVEEEENQFTFDDI